MKPLHPPRTITLLVQVVVPPAPGDEVRALVIDVARETAVDGSRRSVVEGLLETVAVYARIACDPQQPLVRVGVVDDITRLRPHVGADARECFLGRVHTVYLDVEPIQHPEGSQ